MHDPGLDGAIDGLDEVLAVIPEMETEQIVAEQAVEASSSFQGHAKKVSRFGQGHARI